MQQSCSKIFGQFKITSFLNYILNNNIIFISSIMTLNKLVMFSWGLSVKSESGFRNIDLKKSEIAARENGIKKTGKLEFLELNLEL